MEVLGRPKPVTDFPMRRVGWLPGFEGRFAVEMLNLIVGPPDLGKTLYTALLIARATRHGLTPTACESPPRWH